MVCPWELPQSGRESGEEMRTIVTAEQFDKDRQELQDLAASIISRKRPEYTLGNVNVLQNFDEAADEFGVSPAKAIMLHRKKHLDAEKSYLINGHANSEPMDSRFADDMNYLILLYSDYKRTVRESVDELINKTARYSLPVRDAEDD